MIEGEYRATRPQIIEGEFTLKGENPPEPPPRKWWEGWRLSYDPAFIVPGGVVALVAVLGHLLK